jgi:hypothetical protein
VLLDYSDTGSFGSLQALPSFLTRFGIKNDAGKFALPATRKSLLNSLPWIGKIAGCMWSEPFIDRAGYKKAMYAVAIIQIVGLIGTSTVIILTGRQSMLITVCMQWR